MISSTGLLVINLGILVVKKPLATLISSHYDSLLSLMCKTGYSVKMDHFDYEQNFITFHALNNLEKQKPRVLL